MKSFTVRIPAVLCSIALGALVLAGCGDDSTGPDGNNNTDKTVAPKQGSTFNFSDQSQDEDGNPIGLLGTSSDSLLATGLSYGGKTDVYAFYNGRDTMFYRYETNGDISVNVRSNFFKKAGSEWYLFPFINEWITVPFMSKTSKSDTLAKVQNYGTGSVKVPMVVSAESDHVGTETVAVGTESMIAQKVETTITVTIGSLLHRVNVKWSFVPKLGYFARRDFIINPTEFLGPSKIFKGGNIYTLTSYSLK